MTSDRKKPGVAFWATVVVVCVVAYTLSWGPVFWTLSAMGDPAWAIEPYQWIYSPLMWVAGQCPLSIQEAINSYLLLSRDRGRDGVLKGVFWTDL
jgi:hypothetical protein